MQLSVNEGYSDLQSFRTSPCKMEIQLAKEYIDINYSKPITLANVASAVFFSPSHFSHQFRCQVGISFVKYLNLVRLERARYLICNTDIPIFKIASMVGINKPAYFSQLFYAEYGILPKEFRKQGKKIHIPDLDY